MIPNFLDLPVKEADARRGELRAETAMFRTLKIVSRADNDQTEPTESARQAADTCMMETVEHVERPEHDLDVLLDDLEIGHIDGIPIIEHEQPTHVEEPQPVAPPKPTVAEQPEKSDETETVDTDEAELRAALAEIEPNDDTDVLDARAAPARSEVLDPYFAPGCFGSALTYLKGSKECSQSPFAGQCEPLSAERMAYIHGCRRLDAGWTGGEPTKASPVLTDDINAPMVEASDHVDETPIIEHIEQPVHVEEPQPIEPPERLDPVDVSDDELQSVLTEIEDDDDTWERDRGIWHRTKNRLNDRPEEFVAGIRRAVPRIGDDVAAFVTKHNYMKAKDKEVSNAAAHILGVKKRKATWEVKSPPELRAERKKLMEREKKRRQRAAKRAGTP